jgi:hypothetical protein
MIGCAQSAIGLLVGHLNGLSRSRNGLRIWRIREVLRGDYAWIAPHVLSMHARNWSEQGGAHDNNETNKAR